MGGVGLYGVLSILIFFGVFLTALVWAFRLKKSYLDSMRSLPLGEDESFDASVKAEPQQTASPNTPIP